MPLFGTDGMVFIGQEGVFICLGIDAGGALEIAAEIGSSRETELESDFFDGLYGVRVHDVFGAGKKTIFGSIFVKNW
jgi:hypothetical protein